MEDKLSIIKNQQQGYKSSYVGTDSKLTMANDFESRLSSLAASFNVKATQGQTILTQIEEKTQQLSNAQAEVEQAIGSLNEDAASKKIQRIIIEIQNKQDLMNSIINELKGSLDQSGPNDPEFRVKQNQYGSLITRYKSACENFERIQMNIKSILEKKLVRGAEVALNRNLSNDEVEDVLANPQLIQKMIGKELTGAAPVQLQNAVSDLEERHKDIRRLESSIVQIHKMIQELNKLVEEQGHMVDNIEMNIRGAKSYVNKAAENINTAEENMKKAQRKKYIIIAIIAVLVIVAILILILAIT